MGGTATAPRLKPADELLLNWFAARGVAEANTAVCHDRYGVLGTILPAVSFWTDSVAHHHRMRVHRVVNNLPDPYDLANPTVPAPAPAPKVILMQVPKSPDLFEWYINEVAREATSDTKVCAVFQTRYFTPKLLKIANRYAGEVQQSKAYKRARTLVLTDWKEQSSTTPLTHSVTYNGKAYVQYYGVFSAGHVDYATQFLLDTWRSDAALAAIKPPQRILDIGCGNGIIGDQLTRHHYPDASLFGTDVSSVAVHSARENGPKGADYYWSETTDVLPDRHFGLIVTNPPFHDGHRNAIGPTLKLFREASKRLTEGGALVVVANRHLNYATHLRRLFDEVITVAENKKYIIYLSYRSQGV